MFSFFSFLKLIQRNRSSPPRVCFEEMECLTPYARWLSFSQSRIAGQSSPGGCGRPRGEGHARRPPEENVQFSQNPESHEVDDSPSTHRTLIILFLQDMTQTWLLNFSLTTEAKSVNSFHLDVSSLSNQAVFCSCGSNKANKRQPAGKPSYRALHPAR